MVDRAEATVTDIDLSMQLGAGHPMGPLHLADYIGKIALTLTLSDTAVQCNAVQCSAVCYKQALCFSSIHNLRIS